jgi:histidinol dehydrogenase
VVHVDDGGFAAAAPVVAAIADAEGFATHAESVRLRQRARAASAAEEGTR